MTSSTAIKKDKKSNVIAKLNKEFEGLDYRQRIERLYHYFDNNEVLLTSSFGTRSAFLLYLLSEICPQQVITFIDTTYHFPQTLAYKEKLEKRFDLKIKKILPDPIQNQLTTEEKWWEDHPNMCCTVNKIAPLNSIVSNHKVWISGLMAFQTSHRSKLKVFEDRGDIIKFHPLIDISEAEYLYRKGYHKLPEHPLVKEGYGSIGCKHCTEKGENRSGRWMSKGKIECGLHTTFYYNKNQKK